MRKLRTWAASAAALLLFFSAGQAFAGLSLVSTGTSHSWSMTWTVNGSGEIGNVTGGFTSIVATTAGGVSYHVSAGDFTITAPSQFEDLGSAGAHRAWQAFGGTSPSGFSDSSWAQTVPSGSGASNVNTTTAAGNQVLGGGLSSLTFSLFFTGDEHTASGASTIGAHYYLDFLNSSGGLVSRYEIKDIIDANGIQGTEIARAPVPLPASVWGGLAMFAGMGAFFVARRRNRNLMA